MAQYGPIARNVLASRILQLTGGKPMGPIQSIPN